MEAFFSSPSHAGTVAAVKAGMEITVMPQVPKELESLDLAALPKLEDTHVFMLKHHKNNPAINSHEEFVLRKVNNKL